MKLVMPFLESDTPVMFVCPSHGIDASLTGVFECPMQIVFASLDVKIFSEKIPHQIGVKYGTIFGIKHEPDEKWLVNEGVVFCNVFGVDFDVNWLMHHFSLFELRVLVIGLDVVQIIITSMIVVVNAVAATIRANFFVMRLMRVLTIIANRLETSFRSIEDTSTFSAFN